MTQRLVLRFGNQIADTFVEHASTMATQGVVWWGWWAKDEEPDLSDAQIDDLRASIANPIGLYNSHTGEAFTAICEDLRIGTRQRLLFSPDPQCTPAYYQEKAVRGWFQLSAIDPISLQAFQREFGDPPSTRQTIFFGEQLISSPARSFRELKRPVVLHLSDLHFGSDFGFNGVYDDQTSINPAPKLDEFIVSNLQRIGQKVGVVVASGDLVTRGQDSWHDVTAFFDRLLDSLGLEREDLVVIPGNHDVFIDELITDAYPVDYRNERAYRRWYSDFFDATTRPVEMLVSFESQDRVLSFLQLNSCRLRSLETMEFGFVGRDAYRQLLESIGQPARRETRIATMHHHLRGIEQDLRPEKKTPPSMMLDAGQIIEDLQAAGFRVVLHGHKHEDAVQQGGRLQRVEHGGFGHLEPLWLIGSGSSGAKPSRLPERTRANSMMILDFASDEVLCGRCVEYTTRSFNHSGYSFQLPLFPWAE